MTEEWKNIEGYQNYSVSNLGNVRNDRTGRLLKPSKCGGYRSYYQVALYRGTHASRKCIQVHRIVAETFIPNPYNFPEVNHIDGNGFNNCVSNLEWIGHKDNLIHAYKVLNKKVAIGDPFAKKIIRVEDGKIFNSITEAGEACGMKTGANISKCLNRPNQQTAYGYHWKYADE